MGGGSPGRVNLVFPPVPTGEAKQRRLLFFSDAPARTSGVLFAAVPGAKDFGPGALRSPRERPAPGAAGRRAGLRRQLHRGPPARPLLHLAHQGHPRGAAAALPETDRRAQLPQLMGLALRFAKYPLPVEARLEGDGRCQEGDQRLWGWGRGRERVAV